MSVTCGDGSPLKQSDAAGKDAVKKTPSSGDAVKRTPSSGTAEISSISAFEVLKGLLWCPSLPRVSTFVSLFAQVTPACPPVISSAETSEHHTLGGQDLWGKKKRREYMHDKLSESDKEAGFLSAPWKFMKFGSVSRGDTDGADTSGTKWLPVNTVL
jgi:hypothetical protein